MNKRQYEIYAYFMGGCEDAAEADKSKLAYEKLKTALKASKRNKRRKGSAMLEARGKV